MPVATGRYPQTSLAVALFGIARPPLAQSNHYEVINDSVPALALSVSTGPTTSTFASS